MEFWSEVFSMGRVMCLGWVVSALPGLCMAADSPTPQMSLPRGIAIRMTMEGPVFTDAQGMTLYVSDKRSRNEKNVCRERPDALLAQVSLEGSVDFDVAVPDFEHRRGCAQKRPPLLASAGAKPIGKWSLSSREGGPKQ